MSFFDAGFKTAIYRLVPGDFLHAFRKIVHTGSVGSGFIVSMTVSIAVPQLFHQLGWRIPQVHGHRPGFVIAHKGARLIIRAVGRIRFGRRCQIEHGIGECQLTLGRAQTLIRFGGL